MISSVHTNQGECLLLVENSSLVSSLRDLCEAGTALEGIFYKRRGSSESASKSPL